MSTGSAVPARRLRDRMSVQAGGALLLSVINAGLMFLVGVILARELGPVQYGRYAWALAWATLLMVPAQLGAGRLLIRLVAVYSAHSWHDRSTALLQWMSRRVLLAGMVLMLAAWAIALLVLSGDDPRLSACLLACCAVPLLAIRGIHQAALLGEGRPVAAQLPEKVAHPLTLLLLWVVWSRQGHLGLMTAIPLYVLAAAVSLVIAAAQSRRLRDRGRAVAAVSPQLQGEWRTELRPFLFFSCLEIVNVQAGILLLGIMCSPEQAGLYAVACRLILPVGFILLAANSVLLSKIPQLHAAGDHAGLEQLLSRSARFALVATVAVSTCLLLAGPWLLSLFGEDYAAAWLPLAVLTLGYIVWAATGSSGSLLLLTGHQQLASGSLAAATGLILLLTIVLAPSLGALGVAIASSLSMSLNCVLRAVLASRFVGINPTVYGGSWRCVRRVSASVPAAAHAE